MINTRPELSTDQKTFIKQLKKEWTEKIPIRYGIYTDRRKKFYRVKLYMIPNSYIKKAKQIAKKYKLGDIIIQTTSYQSGQEIGSDCIIKIPYSWF
jgi:hypothetical protein